MLFLIGLEMQPRMLWADTIDEQGTVIIAGMGCFGQVVNRIVACLGPEGGGGGRKPGLRGPCISRRPVAWSPAGRLGAGGPGAVPGAKARNWSI